MKKLPESFYLRDDVVQISRELLGKFLVTNINGKLTSGMIIETEAYKGPEDKACHAYNNKRTKRTETMFQNGGCAYVYLCYGIHSLFNVVTNIKDVPHAVLIRAMKPVDGVNIMLKRRNMEKPEKRLAAGPGTLTQALGISLEHDNISLLGNNVWLEDRKISVKPKDIIVSTRIGIDYAEEYKEMPWRFRINW